MAWTNYHSHTHYCDGNSEPEAYVMEAIKQGVEAYGFSGHAPLPFECKWAIPESKVGDYCRHVDFLKEKYSGRIQIYKSLEIDFVPELMGPNHPDIKKLDLDYTIGSIHFIDKFPDGRPWEADGNHWKFATGLLEIFQGDIKRAVKRYFQLTREMIYKDCPDILGHLDKIKIQNHFFDYFSENEPWYVEEIDKTLSVIAQSEVIVEVNTRGLYKKKTDGPYPSLWVLRKMNELEIPVMINSDSHMPKEITLGFAEAAELLQMAGYQSVRVFLDGHWQECGFNKNGLAIPVAV